MKKIILSIGLLLTLNSLHAGEAIKAELSGVYFLRHFISSPEDKTLSRILVECDIESTDSFLSFQVLEAEVVLEDGKIIKSPLYLNEQRLQVKIEDKLVNIGVIIEKLATLDANLTVEARLEENAYTLVIKLPAKEEKL